MTTKALEKGNRRLAREHAWDAPRHFLANRARLQLSHHPTSPGMVAFGHVTPG
jgi:hypothetical protein